MIKILFADVDGTLLDFENRVMSPGTIAGLQTVQNSGIRLMIATGRHPNVLKGLGRITGSPHDQTGEPDISWDGVVGINGQLCLFGDQIVRSYTIPPEDIAALVRYLEAHPFACSFIERDRVYVNLTNERYERVDAILDLGMKLLPDVSRALENPIYQCIFYLAEEEQRGPLAAMPGSTYTRWHPDFIDVVPLGGSKAEGVRAVLDYLGLSPDEALAIGDGENDIAMLDVVGHSVAMGNASDEVKAHADYVTGDVGDEGFLQALEHYGLV